MTRTQQDGSKRFAQVEHAKGRSIQAIADHLGMKALSVARWVDADYLCDTCGESLAQPAEKCGWCLEEEAAA